MKEVVLINGHQYQLTTLTGKVLSTTKALETSIRGSTSGGGGRLREGSGKLAAVDLKMTSTTVVHDQIFLEDERGREHSFQLQGFNLACREGNSLTIVSAQRPGSEQGPYVAVINNTTQNRFFNEPVLRRLSSPASLLYIVGCLAGMAVAFNVFSGITAFVLFVLTPFATALAYGVRTDKGVRAFKEAL